ncbi:Tc5 transposase DNA-binding domain [Popillia japonica]|uniref:Tc5 transposase DNA-binding domain n=1 Tax=Popillia japonica TaxID=7064 RepID=A0AAW1N1E7_POPJA
MESLLICWIEDNNKTKIGIESVSIALKGKQIDLNTQELHDTPSTTTFAASKGWFDRFRKRSSIHNIQFTGEAASADHEAVKRFPQELQTIIEKLLARITKLSNGFHKSYKQ